MPPRLVRLMTSILLVVHLTIVGLSLITHRGTSDIQDDFLSFFDVYRTFGNWRMESNDLLLASSSDLSESVWIEWHPVGAGDDEWVAWPDQNRSPSLNRNSIREQKWIRQLSDLIGLGVTEGASQMVISATRYHMDSGSLPVDRVRVIAAPAIPIDRYEEVQVVESMDELSEDLRPQTVFEATLVDMGKGELSILRKLDNLRVAPATNTGKKPLATKTDLPADSQRTVTPKESGATKP